MLLNQPTVVRWLRGDLGFLSEFPLKNKSVDGKKFKILEDEWGRRMLKLKKLGRKTVDGTAW